MAHALHTRLAQSAGTAELGHVEAVSEGRGGVASPWVAQRRELDADVWVGGRWRGELQRSVGGQLHRKVHAAIGVEATHLHSPQLSARQPVHLPHRILRLPPPPPPPLGLLMGFHRVSPRSPTTTSHILPSRPCMRRPIGSCHAPAEGCSEACSAARFRASSCEGIRPVVVADAHQHTRRRAATTPWKAQQQTMGLGAGGALGVSPRGVA